MAIRSRVVRLIATVPLFVPLAMGPGSGDNHLERWYIEFRDGAGPAISDCTR